MMRKHRAGVGGGSSRETRVLYDDGTYRRE
jgi:hypothetical protein